MLYLNNEIYFEDFLLRFDRMTTDLTAKERAEVDKFVVPQTMPPLDQLWQQLVTIVTDKKPVMVVLDCLYWAHNKQENDSSEMKELMRKLVELRETYGIVVLVVHHTKKGTRYETMHNDNMRGSSVFGGATDTVLMFRRSHKDEGLRLLKPTKLRHGGDEIRSPRLLELDPNSLWFRDLGEADELEHIAAEPGARPKAEDKIDWVAIFDTATILTRKEIHERCEGMKLSERTIDRQLKKASDKTSDDRELDQIEFGKYALHKPADLTLPVAA